MFEFGVQIDGKHTYQDWGLICTGIEVSDPKREIYYIDVPGKSAGLDFTEAMTGDVQYGRREIKIHLLRREREFSRWHVKYSEVFDYCHGKSRRIILDSSRDYYYTGRLKIESEKRFNTIENFMIVVEAEPYKYERYGGVDKWRWNDLNLEDGIIREYKDLNVSGTYTLMISGRRKKVVPVFECTTTMQLTYDGKPYALPVGKSKILDVQLGEGEHYLTFLGNGVVSVDYRGGRL